MFQLIKLWKNIYYLKELFKSYKTTRHGEFPNTEGFDIKVQFVKIVDPPE